MNTALLYRKRVVIDNALWNNKGSVRLRLVSSCISLWRFLGGAGITGLIKADVLGQEFYFPKPHLGAELLKNNGAYMFRNNEIYSKGQDTSLAPLGKLSWNISTKNSSLAVANHQTCSWCWIRSIETGCRWDLHLWTYDLQTPASVLLSKWHLQKVFFSYWP